MVNGALYQGDAGYESAPFVLEVHGVGDPAGHFVKNGLRFNKREDAQAYGRDLSSRWFGMDEWRVAEIPATEKVN